MRRFDRIRLWHRVIALACLAAPLTSACHSGGAQPTGAVAPQGAQGITPAEQAQAELEHPRYTAAGVQFITDMIAHHAQAILMAHWASSHAAAPPVKTLADRIAVSQRDEIALMQAWLRARHQAVPLPDTASASLTAMGHPMAMPGMLTASQLATLDSARGVAFDRLFLTDMIMHHRGAIAMVHELLAPGRDEDDALVMYANNVAADQSAEIGRMERMLANY